MADFDPSFNPDYNPDKPAKETKQASGFNANFNPDYNPDAGVVDEAPPAEPTDPWLKSLTGTSPGSDADAYKRAKDAAERQRIEENKRRGFSEGIGNRIVATLPSALAKGVQGLAEIPRQARLGSEAVISGGLQKIGVSHEKARKTASALSFFNPALVASASQDAFGQETETWKKIEEGQKYLEEHHAPASRGTKFTDPVTGKQFNAKIKDIASNPEMMTQVVAGELAPMLVQTALLKGAGGAAPKGIKAAVTAMAKDPRIKSMLAINAGRIFSSEFKEATEKGTEDLVKRNIEKYGVEPDEATRKKLEASAREKMVAPALAITVATAPIETAFEASWIGHMLEVEGGKGILRKLGSVLAAGVKEGASEGAESVVGNAIKKATYKPEMTLDDALTDIATNFIGGAVAGGSFHSAHTALSSLGSQPEEFYRKPINEEQHKIVLDNLKAQEARLQATGDVEAASRTNDTIKQVEAAQTNADVIKAVVPGAAFGKVGVLAEETIGSGIALGDRLGDPTITEHAIALRDELHGMVEERRALIDDLNAQANEAADIEDLNVAKQILREVNKSKREVEDSFKTRVKELTARAESELGEHAKQTANSVIDQKLQEVQDAAQAREVGQDRIAERQQVGEGGLPAEAGGGDQLAESGQVQQEEVDAPIEEAPPEDLDLGVTDIVSPAQNDVQPAAFEAAREQIRKDETLTPQEKNAAIRKAYDEAKASGGFERTKAVLKEIGNPNNVNDITQVIPNFAKLTDAIVRDLVAMGKAKFENYWNKFKEYVDEGTLKHVEERYGWQARNAYAEALNTIGVASSGTVEGSGQQQGEYDPAGFFAEGADGIRSRSANVDAGFEPDSVASRQAQGLHKTAAFYLLTGTPTNIIDQNGMGISYVVDGNHAYGVNERGGFFMLTDQGGGRVVLDSASTPRGTGLDVMAAAALTAQEVFGATELEGLMSSAGAWMRRGLYPSSRTDGISTDTITTSVDDMINRVVDPNVSPDVLVHAWGLLQMGDTLGAYLAWNVARGTAGEVEFMRAGIDPFKLADDIVRMRNAETGSDKPTLSQMLGINTDSATPGDYYWGIMRAIKRLGSTTGDTSVRLRSRFGLPVTSAKEVASFMHTYKPNPEQKRTRPAGYQKETTEQRVAHALKTSVQDALEASDLPIVKAMAKSVGVANTKTINLRSIFRGEPSIDYRLSPELGGASPGVNALYDKGIRNLYHVGEAFSAESEKVKYAVRDAVDAAIEADSDPAISQEVQRALAIGTLAEITDADGKVIQTGGVLPEDELRAMFSDTFGGDKAKIDKAVSIYWKLRDGADKISEMVREAISYRTKKNIDEQNALIAKETDPKLRDKYRENIRNLRNEERQALERLRNGAYWPLIREGKWRINVRHAETGELLAVVFTDSRKEDAIKKKISEAYFVSPRLEEAVKDGLAVNDDAVQRQDFSALRAMGAAVFDESMALFLSRALGHDPEYAASMARAVTTASVGDTFKLHQLTRSGVPGYTNRAGLSFQHLVNFSANMIANAYHADKLSNAVDAMSQGRMGEDYDPTAHNYAEAYVRNLRNPAFNSVVSLVKAANYAYSLYGYTPFALVNKLQPWVVGLSKLGTLYGNNKSRRALGRAETLVWRHMALQLGMGSMEDLNDADAVAMLERLSDRKNFFGYKNATQIAENVKASLLHALEVGDLRPSLSENLMGIGDSMIVTKMKKTTDTLKRFFGVLALRTEQMNRVQTIIASALLASEYGVKDFDNQGIIPTSDRSSESVAKFSNLVNAVVNMSAGPHNTPAIAWNPYTGGMFQFKRILVDMVVAQHRIAKMASAGAPNNRAAIAAYMKPWLTEMGVATIFAGPAGSPMGAMLLGAVGLIIKSYAKAFDVPEEEIKKGIKDRAISIWSSFFQNFQGMSKEDADRWAEGAVFMMMHGIPNAFGKGVDISQSMAPQLFFSPADASALEILATIILGPAAMTISQASKPFEDSGFNRDSVIAAAKKLIPRGLRGVARAAGIAPYTMAGEPEGGFEKAASAVGFTPSRIAMNQVPTSEKFDISRSKRQTTNRLKLIIREASIKMLDAEKSGSKSKIDKADANFEKEIERARELMDEYHRSMEATGMPQEIWKINWQRDIMPSSKVERQERKREELPGWQK